MSEKRNQFIREGLKFYLRRIWNSIRFATAFTLSFLLSIVVGRVTGNETIISRLTMYGDLIGLLIALFIVTGMLIEFVFKEAEI